MSGQPKRGPVEDGPWAERLAARVVSLDEAPRVHGYDLQDDLLAHYGLSEVVWLALRGELPPDRNASRALEQILGHLFPADVGSAPSHAAGLVRLCGSKPAAVVSVAATTLAQEGQAVLDAHRGLWRWLDGEGRWPVEAPGPTSGADAAAVARLEARLEALGLTLPSFEGALDLTATCLAALHALGWTDLDHVLGLWVWCRLPCVVAEGFAVPRGRLVEYPMNLPRFVYEGADE